MDRRGLTLLELLIAITVLAIITAIVYGAFATVVEGVETARERSSEMRVRQFLSWNITRNVSSAYIHPYLQPPNVPYTFEAESDNDGQGHKDRLEFFSTAPLQGARAMPGDVKQVVIEFVDTEDSDNEFELSPEDAEAREGMPERYLQVVETPMSSSELTSMTNSEAIADYARDPNNDEGEALVESPSWTVPVESFDLRFYDGEQWVEEWIFAERLRLPWSVEVRINFPKTEEDLDYERQAGLDPDEDPDFRLVIAVTNGIGILSTPQEVPGLDPTTLIDEAPQGRDGLAGDDDDDRDSNGRQDDPPAAEPDATMQGADDFQ
jgi:prepilin-type N-terminal cleavage/methylation domain-containing protein